MARTLFVISSCLIQLILGAILSQAKNGEIRHILSHDKVKVVTDPAKGVNPYPRWAQFPDRKIDYRKVVLYVTYQCPDSQRCGEWDYIDYIYLRRIGSQSAASKNIELARMISPYGTLFGPTWKFTWHVDITDFAFLLHDSTEIEFVHGGYESNTDRGWLVTLDFEITEGRPAVAVLGMDSLWQGFIPYGDSAQPIDSSLAPRSFANTYNADFARLRILQTGHGMDDSENCAEFCSKWRRVLVDDSVIAERQIWRKCGINPLSPQAGTWIYDRANWCPGSIVQPDDYDIAIKKGSTHRVAIKMEPYINQKHPTAHYALSTYLFYCKAPWARNDVSLEEIMAPSDADEYSRMNPVCGNPRILVRNSGRNPVTTMTVRYGCPGMKEPRYAWQGNIASQQTGVIELPGAISGCEHGRQFSVTLDSPNGRKDDYTDDNTGTSVVYLPPVYGTDFILALRSNNDSSHNAYAITDLSGAVIRERTLGSLKANTIYYDTLNLAPGCYKLLVRDTAGDGLDFWANPEGGYGYVRLLDMNQRLLKAFTSDFGSETAYWFSVAKDAKPALAGDQLPIVNPFPLRNKGVFTLDLFLNDSTTVNVRIVTEDSSRTVFQKDCPVGRELFLPIDITAEPDGVYYVKATIGEKTISRRIRVRRTN